VPEATVSVEVTGPVSVAVGVPDGALVSDEPPLAAGVVSVPEAVTVSVPTMVSLPTGGVGVDDVSVRRVAVVVSVERTTEVDDSPTSPPP
jgi:hypothetical protein